jgi:staphyloferrin B biosynthesis citrate synthase
MGRMNSEASPRTFRQRLCAKELLLGSFIKSPSSHAIEILGYVGFDFVVIDQEHAPLDRAAIDVQLLAAQAANIAAIVRVSDLGQILAVLDAGATGVLVPHVSSAAVATDVARACRYRNGARGFSASTRAARYGGVGRWAHVDRSDQTVAVIVQIEDPPALDDLDAIANVEGIDGLFIGRGDLTVALALPSSEGPEMLKIVQDISDAATAAGKAICGFAAGAEEARLLARSGISAMVVSSDQGFMRREAERTLKEIGGLNKGHAR